jgi:hypothetical protein
MLSPAASASAWASDQGNGPIPMRSRHRANVPCCPRHGTSLVPAAFGPAPPLLEVPRSRLRPPCAHFGCTAASPAMLAFTRLPIPVLLLLGASGTLPIIILSNKRLFFWLGYGREVSQGPRYMLYAKTAELYPLLHFSGLVKFNRVSH